MRSAPTTAVGLPLDRSFPVRMAGQLAVGLEASGVVDQFMTTDQVTAMFPARLWTPENTALSTEVPDPDSFHDAFQVAAFAAAATESLGVAVTTDSIRRGPAELMQTMLSLVRATDKPATLLLGAGEVKNTKPLGYQRSQGLARMEDLFRVFNLLRAAEEPFDFDGNHWQLRDAWVGGIRPDQPQIFALGGGPKLMTLAARHADGFVGAIPVGMSSPERFAEHVADMKRQLEECGRDPEAFEFGFMVISLLHEDAEALERAWRNPVIRWMAAVSGRLNMADWEPEGVRSVFPREWHYSLHMTPTQMSAEEIDRIVADVPEEMPRKAFMSGSPQDVAKELEPWIEAGATWLTFFALMPLALSIEEAPASVGRAIEVCRLVKAGPR